MYMDDIKIFVTKEKKTRNPNTSDKNIQPEYSNGICEWKMCQG